MSILCLLFLRVALFSIVDFYWISANIIFYIFFLSLFYIFFGSLHAGQTRMTFTSFLPLFFCSTIYIFTRVLLLMLLCHLIIPFNGGWGINFLTIFTSWALFVLLLVLLTSCFLSLFHSLLVLLFVYLSSTCNVI